MTYASQRKEVGKNWSWLYFLNCFALLELAIFFELFHGKSLKGQTLAAQLTCSSLTPKQALSHSQSTVGRGKICQRNSREARRGERQIESLQSTCPSLHQLIWVGRMLCQSYNHFLYLEITLNSIFGKDFWHSLPKVYV